MDDIFDAMSKAAANAPPRKTIGEIAGIAKALHGNLRNFFAKFNHAENVPFVVSDFARAQISTDPKADIFKGEIFLNSASHAIFPPSDGLLIEIIISKDIETSPNTTELISIQTLKMVHDTETGEIKRVPTGCNISPDPDLLNQKHINTRLLWKYVLQDLVENTPVSDYLPEGISTPISTPSPAHE